MNTNSIIDVSLILKADELNMVIMKHGWLEGMYVHVYLCITILYIHYAYTFTQNGRLLFCKHSPCLA